MMMIRRVVVSMEVSWLNQTEQLPRGTLVRAKAANEYEPYWASQRSRNHVLPKITTHEMSVSAKMRRGRRDNRTDCAGVRDLETGER